MKGKTQIEIARAQFGVALGGDAGATVLEHLKNKFFIDHTTFNKGNTKEELFYREGQRSVILHILNMLKGS